MNARYLWVLGCYALALGGCKCSKEPKVVPVNPAKAHATAADAPKPKHWGYEDGEETIGPAGWGTLAGNERCSSGKEQTPVDLRLVADPRAAAADLPNLEFHYQPSALRMKNNGHSIQLTYDSGSALQLVGEATAYSLAQIHFHAPSEHTLDGRHYPVEAHLVHLDAQGKPAVVVGIMLEAGAENQPLKNVFAAFPLSLNGTSEPAGQKIDAAELFPNDKTFFTYSGSLTTPPCSEGVRWFVMRSPVQLSQPQIDAFLHVPGMNHTNRPIQPLYERQVRVDSTP